MLPTISIAKNDTQPGVSKLIVTIQTSGNIFLTLNSLKYYNKNNSSMCRVMTDQYIVVMEWTNSVYLIIMRHYSAEAALVGIGPPFPPHLL